MFDIRHFDSIDSTNDYLKIHANELSNYTVITADYQTSGRGQFDRTWQSNQGENLLCSILIKDVKPSDLIGLKVLILRYIMRVLKDYQIEAYYKYPNDIYIGDEKISGILLESQSILENVSYVVIGIGLNVNQVAFEHLAATSIRKKTGQMIDLNQFRMIFIEGLSFLIK